SSRETGTSEGDTSDAHSAELQGCVTWMSRISRSYRLLCLFNEPWRWREANPFCSRTTTFRCNYLWLRGPATRFIWSSPGWSRNFRQRVEPEFRSIGPLITSSAVERESLSTIAAVAPATIASTVPATRVRDS